MGGEIATAGFSPVGVVADRGVCGREAGGERGGRGVVRPLVGGRLAGRAVMPCAGAYGSCTGPWCGPTGWCWWAGDAGRGVGGALSEAGGRWSSSASSDWRERLRRCAV